MRRLALATLLCVLFFICSLNARVVRVEITSRQDLLNGKLFGEAGAYERIVGRVYFSVLIENPHNRRIVDLANAINLKNGEVDFSADFVAIRPKDPRKSNGGNASGKPEPRS